MLVKPFEDQARTRPGQIAVKTAEEALTYEELEKRANRLAHFINREAPQGNENPQTVALLFNHGIPMIIAILAALKAGRRYVPLSPDYPYRRLSYMISNSESLVILTESRHREIAGKLALENNILYLNVHNRKIDACPGDPPPRSTRGGQNAYILYTSGSTGWPKGVRQTHENVLYYIGNWTRCFSITSSDRMTLLSSFCHDASVQDMFGALHNGAALYPVDVKNRQYTIELSQYLVEEKITIWHSVPSLYSYFVNSLTGKERFPHLRFILLGGEALRENEIIMFKKYFPHSTLANVYGQTEASVNSIWLVYPKDSFDKIIIGEPMDNTGILLMDEKGNEADPLDIGEIIIRCPYLSPGYWKDEAATRQSFRRHPDYGLLYRTGDLGRLLLDGSIEFIGRKDTQVKIRGYRIELGEIESRLLEHHNIREAAVSIHEDKQGDIHLCAYIAPGNETKTRETPNTTELREYLAQYLPDYMIPTYFMSMERLPLTASGKINRKALPEPKIEIQSTYTAPGNPIEKKLVEMWSEILAIEKERIGIDMNFFELGGQSLKAVTLVLKIHQSLDVILPLAILFKTPTIRDLAKHIQGLEKNKYAPIEPAEEKEYYPLSSSQKRLYILQQMETHSIGYNMPGVFHLAEDIDNRELETVFKKLISRQESLRTSFEIIAEEPVQRVHHPDEIEFTIEYYDKKEVKVKVEDKVRNGDNEGTRGLAPLLFENFIRPFDLSRAPLLRVGIIELEGKNHILMIDQHHIITDGTSQAILRKEFAKVYEGKQLEPLRIRYKDYARWLEHEKNKNRVKNQEAYWLEEFKEQIRPLNLPLDYSRPAAQSFEGGIAEFVLGQKETKRLNELAANHGATLFMVLLTIFNVLLSKLGGQEDIVVGTPTAGRRHAELEYIVGMFVNTLALRNYPAADMDFNDFLKNVKERTLQAFENQDYPFENLVDKVSARRDPGRNPLFDVMFSHRSQQLTTPSNSNELLKPAESHRDREKHGYQYRDDQSKFDLVLASLELGDRVNFVFGYRTKLFKKETIQRFVKYFKEITAAVTGNENGEILLKNIKISHQLREVKSGVYESIESRLEF